MANKNGIIYCPICKKQIEAENLAEVDLGEHDGYLFVHDDVPHSDEDIETLTHGIN